MIVWVKMEAGSVIGLALKNFSVGISLPRATPAWSGTMHSTSSTPRARHQARAASMVSTPRSAATGESGSIGVDIVMTAP